MMTIRTRYRPSVLVVALLGAVAQGQQPPPPAASASKVDAPATYVGSDTCGTCHEDIAKAFAKTPHHALTEVAAEMWNHEPIMAKAGATPARFAPGEMRDLPGYLWAQQFFQDAGIPAAGRRVFTGRRCASCHEEGKAPNLTGIGVNGATMVSALWRHGPSMLSEMKKEGVQWPRFEGSQMADLIAYLNTKK